jgi:hypothetical protein
MAKGMNMGIFSLLIVVLFVLGLIAAFGIFLMRRAAQFPSLPFPEETGNSSGAAPDLMPDPVSQLTK